MKPRRVDEPNMSDTTILMSLEDLINIAMGPPDKNLVNYKMVQTVLHILARQMRLLETHVELRIREHSPIKEKLRKKKDEGSAESSSSKSPRSKRSDEAKDEGRRRSGSRRTSRDRGRETTKDGASKEKSEDTSKEKDDQDKREKGAEKDKRQGKGKDKEKDAQKESEGKKDDKSKRGKEEKGKGTASEGGKKETTSGPGMRETVKPGKVPSGTSIAVKEIDKDKEKVLSVEKAPVIRIESRPRIGSIEVVTISQFAKLEAELKDLKALAGPLPTPTIPDNEKIKTGIMKGTTSLTDMMQTMQVSARIQAAEQAVSRMADLLTQLAAAGAVPDDLVDAIRNVKAEADQVAAASEQMDTSGAPRKSVAIDPASHLDGTTRPTSGVSRRPSAMSKTSVASMKSQPVSHREMDDMLQNLKEELMKNMNQMSSKAASTADNAAFAAKNVSDKLGTALAVNNRLTTLHSLVADYSEQLSGFDAGLASQMKSFNEQIVQINGDLTNGLKLMEKANNSGETAAVMELSERYEGLVTDLEHTMSDHQALTNTQTQLEDQLRRMVECVEMLREQKADRDEVADGLRDKADISRLAGLLSELDFARARSELEQRLQLCYEKFNKQEAVWLGALDDLSSIADGKADMMQLMSTRDDAESQLQQLLDKLRKLAVLLGDPKAAMLTRKLSRDATCGACMVPALMETMDENFGAPPPLPALRPQPKEETDEICFDDFKPEDHKARHVCHRWVGGSHTLISEAVTRERAPPVNLEMIPTKKYTGYGSDGRLYMLEEELQPCLECNTLNIEKEMEAAEKPKETGAGDTGKTSALPQ